MLISRMSIIVFVCATMLGWHSPLMAKAAQKPLKIYIAYGKPDFLISEIARHTGIAVEHEGMSSGAVLKKLRSRKDAGPIGDVWLGGGVDSFIKAKNAGLLEKYLSPNAKHIPSLFRDRDGFWTGVSIVVINFIVNPGRAKEKGAVIPQSWSDLLQPEFKGEILMSDPAISGTAYIAVQGILQSMGEEKGWEYLESLNRQIRDYPKRGFVPPTSAAKGDVIVGMAPGVEPEWLEGYETQTVYPRDGIPWWPSPVAIIKGTKNLENSKKVIDWCLSAQGQEVLKKAAPRLPARQDVSPPEVLRGLNPEKLMTIDFVQAGMKRDTTLQRWRERIRITDKVK